MGIYIDSEHGYRQFELLRHKKYFVDKSNIIHEFNKLLHDDMNCVCITKPRGFGKTSIASLIIAYYSKSRKYEFKKIFDELEISKDSKKTSDVIIISGDDDINSEKTNSEYEKTQGKYHTIYIDFSNNIKRYKNIYDFISSIEKNIIKELKDIFKCNIDQDNLNNYLSYLYSITKETFIFVIDEWDYIFNNNLFNAQQREDYLIFLKDLLKNKPYIAFTYMTGVLPIPKRTELNHFLEYSMLVDDKYYEYFGFTEDEVWYLCNIDQKIKYEDIKNWYHGYKVNNGVKVYNPWSICTALTIGSIRNYWTTTGSKNDIKDIINFNIPGVKEDFLNLILGNKIKIKLEWYGLKYKQKNAEQRNIEQISNEEAKNEIYSELVVNGLLNYNQDEINIPNKELFEQYEFLFRNMKDFDLYYKLRENSKEMTEATLNSDTERIGYLLKEIHIEKAFPKEYNSETLGLIVQFAYYDARHIYKIEQENIIGKGFVDFIFYPKNKRRGIVVILKLKVGESTEDTIQQIYERQYYLELRERGYEGKIQPLLVGSLSLHPAVVSALVLHCPFTKYTFKLTTNNFHRLPYVISHLGMFHVYNKPLSQINTLHNS